MIKTQKKSASKVSDREALRRRIKQMYVGFNRERWEKCYLLIDPRLRDQSKVQLPVYMRQLKAFKETYGAIKPWHVRISLHLDNKASKRADRPFAYVYVVWQDDAHEFHMFRERWVKQDGRWYTRVAGLVANQQESNRDRT